MDNASFHHLQDGKMIGNKLDPMSSGGVDIVEMLALGFLYNLALIVKN
jgi:hypothetical protein